MRLILYSLFLIIIIMSLNCQKKEKEDIKNREFKKEVIYSTDTSSLRLPQEFTAINPIDLYERLTNLDVHYQDKGEFETTEEYKIRLQNLMNKHYQTPIYNNLTLDSLFTIQLENNFSYDADKEIMEVGIYMSSSVISNSRFGSNIFEKDLKNIYKNFENSAVFHVDIIKGTTYNYWYELEFANYSEFEKYFYPSLSDDKSLQVKIPMKRDYAQKEKENLRLIATIKIIKPWYTFSINPYSKNSYYKTIYANIVQFWIYNYKTGEIYFKI